MSDNPQNEKPAFTDGIISVPSHAGEEPIRATLSLESGWSCNDPDLLNILNNVFPFPDNPFLDFRPQNPNPMLDLMREVVSVLAGEIVQLPESTLPANTVY